MTDVRIHDAPACEAYEYLCAECGQLRYAEVALDKCGNCGSLAITKGALGALVKP